MLSSTLQKFHVSADDPLSPSLAPCCIIARWAAAKRQDPFSSQASLAAFPSTDSSSDPALRSSMISALRPLFAWCRVALTSEESSAAGVLNTIVLLGLLKPENLCLRYLVVQAKEILKFI